MTKNLQGLRFVKQNLYGHSRTTVNRSSMLFGKVKMAVYELNIYVRSFAAKLWKCL